ncbi:immunity 22 family protein [Actinoplanes sp. G11-F43]|uniref:immunity 22 family protein n=1 Tax=Actinoplanes sp. G11-F43 TaxID=3424130 RepID=UPI003D348220
MTVVWVFLSTGRFGSDGELRDFVEPSYLADGDTRPSVFARETGLADAEPSCVETVHAGAAIPVRDLLAEASWADQWITHLDPAEHADSAICVFPPNRLTSPHTSSLEFRGAFPFTSAPFTSAP